MDQTKPTKLSKPETGLRIRTAVRWVTDPSLVNGIVLGVAISIVGSLVWNLELVRTTILLLAVAVLLFCLGAIATTFFLKRRSNEIGIATKQIRADVAHIDESDLARLFSPDPNERASAGVPLFKKTSSSVIAVIESVLAIVARIVAFGRLFAILGVVVSLAIFFATYLQVERLAEQNRLLRLDSLASFQRVAAELRRTIGDAQAMSSIASELTDILDDDLVKTEGTELIKFCGAAMLDHHTALDRVLRKVDSDDPAQIRAEECAGELANLLNKRAATIESSRLTTLGFGVGRPFTRDLTEEFLSQFPSICGTDPAKTTRVARDWRALMLLQESFHFLDQVLNDDPEVELLTAGDRPLDALTNPIDTFSDDIGDDHLYPGKGNAPITFRGLHIAVLSVSAGINVYLADQISGCDSKSTQTLSILTQLEQESAKLVDGMRQEQIDQT